MYTREFMTIGKCPQCGEPMYEDQTLVVGHWDNKEPLQHYKCWLVCGTVKRKSWWKRVVFDAISKFTSKEKRTI